MKRRDLLTQNLTEEKNVTTIVNSAVAADQKFMKRTKRDLEDEIEDLEEKLSQRLSSNTPIDKSTVEQVFAGLKEKKALLETYEQFEVEYLSDDNTAK